MNFHWEGPPLPGVHTIGYGEIELIGIVQCTDGLGGGLADFREAAFNYPTLAECCKIAMLDNQNKSLL